MNNINYTVENFDGGIQKYRFKFIFLIIILIFTYILIFK
jgi:hypothetical protein